MKQIDMRSVELRMLRTFDALIRERSVSRAASRLFLTQSTVSASLRRLRDTFGDPLFTRTAQGVAPTERALELAPHVDRVLLELAALLNHGHGFIAASSRRVFRIAGSDHLSRLILPVLANRLVRLGSAIRVYWETGAFDALSAMLRRGDVDLAVLPAAQTPRDAESILLYEDRYALAVKKGHPERATISSLRTFCDLPHVVLSRGNTLLDDQIDRALFGLGCRREVQIAVTSFSQIVDILLATNHIAVMPLRVIRTHSAVVEAHGLPIDLLPYRLLASWNTRQGRDGGIEWLRSQIEEILASRSQTIDDGSSRP